MHGCQLFKSVDQFIFHFSLFLNRFWQGVKCVILPTYVTESCDLFQFLATLVGVFVVAVEFISDCMEGITYSLMRPLMLPADHH